MMPLPVLMSLPLKGFLIGLFPRLHPPLENSGNWNSSEQVLRSDTTVYIVVKAVSVLSSILFWMGASLPTCGDGTVSFQIVMSGGVRTCYLLLILLARRGVVFLSAEEEIQRGGNWRNNITQRKLDISYRRQSCRQPVLTSHTSIASPGSALPTKARQSPNVTMP
eukprot:763867-Hanusia_phi.AAC.6